MRQALRLWLVFFFVFCAITFFQRPAHSAETYSAEEPEAPVKQYKCGEDCVVYPSNPDLMPDHVSEDEYQLSVKEDRVREDVDILMRELEMDEARAHAFDSVDEDSDK